MIIKYDYQGDIRCSVSYSSISFVVSFTFCFFNSSFGIDFETCGVIVGPRLSWNRGSNFWRSLTSSFTPLKRTKAHRIQIKSMSVNDAWQGRRFKTPEYKEYEEELLWRLPQLDIPQNEPLILLIRVGFSSRASDLSNILKPLEDILCKKYGIDDKWNFEIHLYKEIVTKGEEYIEFKLGVI